MFKNNFKDCLQRATEDDKILKMKSNSVMNSLRSKILNKQEISEENVNAVAYELNQSLNVFQQQLLGLKENYKNLNENIIQKLLEADTMLKESEEYYTALDLFTQSHY